MEKVNLEYFLKFDVSNESKEMFVNWGLYPNEEPDNNKRTNYSDTDLKQNNSDFNFKDWNDAGDEEPKNPPYNKTIKSSKKSEGKKSTNGSYNF